MTKFTGENTKAHTIRQAHYMVSDGNYEPIAQKTM